MVMHDRVTLGGVVLVIAKIDDFLHKTGMPWSRFGRLATGDPRFVEDVRNGRTLRPRTEQRVAAFINTYREGCHD